MTALREIIDNLSSPDEALRIYAAEDLGYANDPDGVPVLVECLKTEKSRAVREAAFAALAQITDESVVAAAVNLLDSEDPFLRNSSVELLQARGHSALEQLERAFREGNTDRRKFIVDIVSRVADAAASGIYELALADPDINVVITAVESIGNTRHVRFRRDIEALVSRDAHPMLLGAALHALSQIGQAESVSVVDAAMGGASGVPSYLKGTYVKLLGAHGGPEHVDSIVGTLDGGKLSRSALGALLALRTRFPGLQLPEQLIAPLRATVAESTSSLEAHQAIRLFGGLLHLGGAFEYVVSCLSHSDKAVRIGAVQALSELGHDAVDAVLRDRLRAEIDEEVLQAWDGERQ